MSEPAKTPGHPTFDSWKLCHRLVRGVYGHGVAVIISYDHLHGLTAENDIADTAFISSCWLRVSTQAACGLTTTYNNTHSERADLL